MNINFKYCSLGLLTLVFVLSCKDNPGGPSASVIRPAGVLLSGCSLGDPQGPQGVSASDVDYKRDTVIITRAGDTTSIFINLEYICSWKFSTSHALNGDTLHLYIDDICQTECGAWCRCSYGFTFMYTGVQENGIICKAEFRTGRPGDSRVIGIKQIL